ncbi:MAG: hypothetical protein B7Y86_14695 [Brevundimonas subvibrioides]|uniref:Uncharacterized protein n=1 Tax=Brevundimonas subvibrioides TaxID=74313 RepID=A0A258HDJ6_9CAUL|nr:hypothetical protein [Brevundimonas subvibrioides]OYX55051.1 MAG: hypothetical protein B7Y86_14695 [Brevundimonas subvibrioides]
MSIRNLLIDLNAAEDLPRLHVVLALAADPGAADLTAVAARGVTPPGHGFPVGPGVMQVRERDIRTAVLSLQADLVARAEDLRLEWGGDVTADGPLPCLRIH